MQFKICEMCKIEERKRNGILRSNYKQTTIKQENKMVAKRKSSRKWHAICRFWKVFFALFPFVSHFEHDVLIIQCTSRRMMTWSNIFHSSISTNFQPKPAFDKLQIYFKSISVYNERNVNTDWILCVNGKFLKWLKIDMTAYSLRGLVMSTVSVQLSTAHWRAV